jgi:hypothetical protein
VHRRSDGRKSPDRASGSERAGGRWRDSPPSQSPDQQFATRSWAPGRRHAPVSGWEVTAASAGIGKSTVSRARQVVGAGVPNGTPETISGRDGMFYPYRHPSRHCDSLVGRGDREL